MYPAKQKTCIMTKSRVVKTLMVDRTRNDLKSSIWISVSIGLIVTVLRLLSHCRKGDCPGMWLMAIFDEIATQVEKISVVESHFVLKDRRESRQIIVASTASAIKTLLDSTRKKTSIGSLRFLGGYGMAYVVVLIPI